MKIDLGVHVDGYIATIAHTIVVGATEDNKVSVTLSFTRCNLVNTNAYELFALSIVHINQSSMYTHCRDQILNEYLFVLTVLVLMRLYCCVCYY